MQYYITAANGKGHGIHSPFVYDFVEQLLNDKKEYPCYKEIENRRKELLNDHTTIDVEDFGAGSSVIKTRQRIVSKIAASSLKPKKYAQLLFRMAQHYKPQTILELGTSFGITTSYLACGNAAAKVYTCEGAGNIAAVALQTFEQLRLKNIQLLQGDFALTLPQVLQQVNQPDLVFIDGNHRHKPTVQYFEQLLAHSSAATIFIFDDIHWSAEMEAAWKEVQQHERVTLTIDLFFIGMVCINPGVKAKQHFTIRY